MRVLLLLRFVLLMIQYKHRFLENTRTYGESILDDTDMK